VVCGLGELLVGATEGAANGIGWHETLPHFVGHDEPLSVGLLDGGDEG